MPARAAENAQTIMTRSGLPLILGIAGLLVLLAAAAAVVLWPKAQDLVAGAGAGAGAEAKPSIYAVGASSGKPLKPGGVSVDESDDEGFVLMVESEPPGASVSVDGTVRGEAPAAMNLDCTPGAQLKVELTREGYAKLEHTLACGKDRMVRLRAKLQKR